ncbi:helix-turn-helix transcriptional regulator [Paenibacillus albidus]|nr:helix-turn-helix domain-containing protein [Paenibacillus albidus]
MVKGILEKWKRYSKKWSGGKGMYYRKNLILVLAVSSIPGFIVGALVYWMAGGRLESELLSMHNRQIEQRAANIDEQLVNMELMLAHWAFDPKFDYTLKNLDVAQKYERSWDITKTLLVMQGSSTMVKRVELYLSGEQPLLFNPEYGTVDNSQVSVQYDKLLRSRQSTYWTQWAFDPDRPGEKDLTLVHLIPGGSLKPFGTLLLRMDPEKVAVMLRTMTPYDSGETFMLQPSGDLFISAGDSADDSPFVAALQEAIQERGTGGGSSFLFDWGNATYAVTSGSFSRIAGEWTYVSASPITSITAPVVFISRLIFLVSSCALLLAALLSWLASRRIYSPVGRLLQTLLPEHAAAAGKEDEFKLIERQWNTLHGQSHALQYTLDEQLPHVKESFLNQLFQGYLYGYSEQDLQNRMKRFKWEVEDCHFMVLYIQLTGISSLEGKFRGGDESLVSFAAVNIIAELSAAHFNQADVVNFHDLTAGLLLIEPGACPAQPEVQGFSEELTGLINRMLNMRVTVAFSAPVESISAIPLAFEAAKQAASYRQFGGENQIINMDRPAGQGQAAPDTQYSFMLERALIQALRTGEAEEAYRLLEEFLGALCADGAKVIDVQQGMLHLLGSIQHTIMDSGIHPNQLFQGVNLYAALSQIHEPKLILAWFREKVVAPFLKELCERSDAGIKRTVEQAMLYIQEHYMDNISLDSCADYTGTNPFLLSKSFKRVTGKNFIDYLTELRLGKAKELLRDTGLRINDVADQVGYQHSYFNRIFKKQEGITPSRYRELSHHE